MNMEKRSLKYIEFHMFETFPLFFIGQIKTKGFWHDDKGLPRYESVVENKNDQDGLGVSCLFPHFDPDSDEYDTYKIKQ